MRCWLDLCCCCGSLESSVSVACFLDSRNPSGECVRTENLWGLFFFLSPMAGVSLHTAKQSQIASVPVAVRGFI